MQRGAATNQRRPARPVATCRLCGDVQPLCESHVIPRFMYEVLRNDKGFFEFADLVDDSVPDPIFSVSKYLPSGWYEYMLCEGCECKIGKWETYGRDVLRGEGGIKLAHTSDRIILYDIDYTRFKLFQMSILWKSSVCSRPEFGEVNLGRYEERLRQCLLHADPRAKTEFGCALTVLAGHDGQRVHPPRRVNQPHIEIYYFVMGGFHWFSPVGEESLHEKPIQHMISTDGVLILSKMNYRDFMRSFGVRGTVTKGRERM